MALSQRLEIKLGQNLVMTPQLRQAIKLLELSHQDLATYVEGELESNPFLETEENYSAPSSEKDRGNATDIDTYDRWREEPSLSDYLQEQVNCDIVDPIEKIIAQQLIYQLDENGYLQGSLEEIAHRLDVPLLLIETVLKRLQQFDPPGIFARNLRECLALQLAEKNRLDPYMQHLLDHLDLVGKKEFGKLRHLLNIDEEDLTDMITELRHLDPRPGLHFGATPIQSIEPDILVSQHNDGTWQVELNPVTLPRLIVNRDYRMHISVNKEDKTYLSEKIAAANWLVRALDQRAQTILRVAREIIRNQDGFLMNGMSQFKPLLRREIAASLQIHESTVSRVTANKYMATPKGIFALSDFFGIGLGPDHAASSKSVMYLIKEQIQAEKKPLSDEQLVNILKKKGIDIARRTIAKYREIMKIPSSAQRKKNNALSLTTRRLHEQRRQ